ncbi:MAG: ATP-dependent DNA ligase [Acidimicrobiia bacterium]|nr:ATP-dependent DNA ligase [Acidimicrobiia bacterium]
MLLARIAEASEAVASTRSRKAKAAVIADLLSEATEAEIPIVVGFLAGVPRQGKVGIGWATVSDLRHPEAPGPGLDVEAVDEFLEAYPSITGPGSQERRAGALGALISGATFEEVDFLRRLLTGELRQGALEGVMVDAIAAAFDVPAAAVRRAAMLSGDLGRTAAVASAGAAALDEIGLRVLSAVQPMLAASAPDVATAVGQLGRAAVEWKLDGTRIQAHRCGPEVRVFTRNLNDVTDRLPTIVSGLSALDVESVILDGESMALAADGGPLPFEQTMSEFGSDGPSGVLELRPFWFDILHLDGEDLIDRPLAERRSLLADVVPPDSLIPQITTDDADEAARFLSEARALRHEGVMVKDPDSPYEAGRRGSAWIKVKPVYTLDLVILAAEWGSGRRTGWLSNLHLGARDPDGGFVMLGKTFKGLTDQMLEFQTEALLDLEERRTKRTVYVRPELVVEVAFDGLLPSTRYPGGMALRFARVRAHRPDKDPEDADTIDTVREIFASRRL